MAVQLRPHQEGVINKLRNGSILQGTVGSGKSITSVAYYFIKIAGGKITPEFTQITKPVDLYIITTAAKRNKLEWNEELARFGLSVNSEDNPLGINIVIDSWNNIKKYEKIKKAFFIFDEQKVVGSGAWARTFIKISKWNRWILLTATPGDTWIDYVPVFIANGFYKNRTEFISQHVVYARYVSFPMIQRYTDEHILEQHRRSLLVIMDYSREAKVNKTFIPVEFDEQAINKLAKERWNYITEEPVKNVSEYCALQRRITYSEPKRIEIIKDLIKRHKKVIIFYNFNYELEMLRNMVNDIQITNGEWNGHKHDPIPTGMQWVYLVQYTAGAEGWNCITTNQTIFFSLNYSFTIMEQAAGRIDRMNTPFPDLNYYYILSKSPIDKAVMKALREKRTFNAKGYERW